MELYPLKTQTGRLTDACFKERRCTIAYAINAIACDPFGIVKDLNNLYTHERSLTSRKRLSAVHRATRDSRGEPGQIIIQNPAVDSEDSPTLVACVTQFGWGDELENNERAQQALNSSRDYHYIDGLKKDTGNDRLANFQKCLNKLAILAMGDRDMEKIVFPEGIGRRGKTDDVWQKNYLPLLQSFGARLKPTGIEVYIIISPQ